MACFSVRLGRFLVFAVLFLDTEASIASRWQHKNDSEMVDFSGRGYRSMEEVEPPDDDPARVHVLDLAHNNLTRLNNSLLDRFPSLRAIRLSHNPISWIQDLSSETIEEIILDHIHLHYFKPTTFKNMTSLTTLTVSYNERFRAFHAETHDLISDSLLHVHASHCDIREIRFGGMKNLLSIDVSHNKITEVTRNAFHSNTKLRSINLSSNTIHTVDVDTFVTCQMLSTIRVSHNFIANMKWVPLNVTYLNLRGNKIHDLKEVKLPLVHHLDVSKNAFGELPEDLDYFFPQLTTLELRHNNVRHLGEISSATLRNIDLSDCKLNEIDEHAFKNVPNLTTLNLYDNKVKSMRFLSGLNKRVPVNLSDNAWDCDCGDVEGWGWTGLVCDGQEVLQVCLPSANSTEPTEPSSTPTVAWAVGAAAIAVTASLLIFILLRRYIRSDRSFRNPFRRVITNRKEDRSPSAPLDLLSQTTPRYQLCNYVAPPLEETAPLAATPPLGNGTVK